MSEFNPKDYWEKRLEASFGLHGVGHINLGTHFNNWTYRIKAHVFRREMKSLGLRFGDLNVLDIGSGTGFYIDIWRNLGAGKIIGTDITDVAVEKLKRKYPGDEFHRVDIGENVDILGNREFDIISAIDVLFHIVDDAHYKTAVENVYSLLKPGGIFILSEFFPHLPAVRMEHLAARSLDEIESILAGAGFEIVKRCPLLVLLNDPIDSESRRSRWFWRRVVKYAARGEVPGYIIGALFYPLEMLLVSMMKESPTTELMICRKPE